METDLYVKSCIYGIKESNKYVYIGRHNTTNYLDRWKQHKKQSKKNPSSLLHKKMLEYGVENFSIEKICECDTKDVGEMEIKYIKEYNTLIPNGYNMQKGGASKSPQPKILRKCSYTGCNFTTLHRTKFDNHTRTHTREKPYKCDIQDCNYSCIRNDQLVRHSKTHSGERKFICDISGCNHKFITKTNLLRHKLQHSGENPYKCNIATCIYRCKSSNSLKYHMRTHYVCEI
jgi:group I intron endonuclease